MFRDKTSPSYPGNPVVFTNDGEKKVLSSSLRMTVKDFFTPVRCRLCFDKLNVFADVVLGDPHSLTGVDRLNGETLVLVRSEIGRKFVEEASRSGVVELRERSIEQAVNGQGVEKKRIEWSGYMKAWSDMGISQPVYPFVLPAIDETGKQRKWSLHGL